MSRSDQPSKERPQPAGGKTLGLILLAMVFVLAVLVALSIWASGA
ncbi:hypothetical protein [Spongiactinospora rosea]|nr:hypothetical protein [Spongiactinospora rosea]